nr:methyltransferase domain-containing protein [Rhodoferax sp.]
MTVDAARMEFYYASRASEYDDVYLKPERQRDLRDIEKWLPPIFAKATVLEVACGTGYWTQFLAPAASRVVGLDASPETLQFARGRVLGENVSFVVGDAYSVPLRLGKFSAAFAGFWFSHVPLGRRSRFLRGLNASLSRGSRVVLLDNRFVEGSSSPISETDAEGNTYQIRKLKDGSTHRVLKNFPTEEELHGSLATAGVHGKLTAWKYFWAFEYVASEP